MPDPDVSETLTSLLLPAFERRDIPRMKRIHWLLRSTMGQRRVTRAMRLVWP